MAELHNFQPVRGIRLVSDGTTMHNMRQVIGVVDAGGAEFSDNQQVLGVDVLEADTAVHNDQTVLGAVVIVDGRKLYNGHLVIPVHVVSGVLA